MGGAHILRTLTKKLHPSYRLQHKRQGPLICRGISESALRSTSPPIPTICSRVSFRLTNIVQPHSLDLTRRN